MRALIAILLSLTLQTAFAEKPEWIEKTESFIDDTAEKTSEGAKKFGEEWKEHQDEAIEKTKAAGKEAIDFADKKTDEAREALENTEDSGTPWWKFWESDE